MFGKILTAFGVFLATFAAGLFLLQLTAPSPLLQGNLLTPPKPYYSTSRVISTAVLSQKDTGIAELNRSNLLHAAVTLSSALKKDQHYDQIIVLTDPNFPPADPDPFREQFASDFPGAAYHLISPGGRSEAEIYAELLTLTGRAVATAQTTSGAAAPDIAPTADTTAQSTATLLVLHSYLNFSEADADLLAFQQEHYRDVFDNISKAALATLPFTNSEALKAIYQLAKEGKSLRALPTLADDTHQYRIKFLAEGLPTPTHTATLTFFGDLMLGRYVRTLMDRHGHDYPFENMDNGYLRVNALLVANLEGPVAEKQINTTKSIAFRFHPDVVPLLARYHFDAVSLANNHALDMGAQGLEDSFRLLPEGGVAAFGHPKSVGDGRAVLLREINGQKIALIGLNDTDFKVKKEEVTAKISELAAAGYHVIPYIHWGTEYVHQPGGVQTEMAHAFVDAGAMAVIGMHPHVVQSIEIYNNAPIFYSLGNAIFDQYFSLDTQEGLSLSLRLTPEAATWYLLPIKIERSQFRLMTPGEKQPFLEKLAGWGGDDQEIKEQIVKGKIVINFTNN